MVQPDRAKCNVEHFNIFFTNEKRSFIFYASIYKSQALSVRDDTNVKRIWTSLETFLSFVHPSKTLSRPALLPRLAGLDL